MSRVAPASEQSDYVLEGILTKYKRFAAKLQALTYGFAILGFVALTITSFKLRGELQNVERSAELQQSADKIMYYDEALTMSAWAAALSGDPHWVHRYYTFVDPIDTEIAKVGLLAPTIADEFAAKTYQANMHLIEFESTVLDLVLAGGVANSSAAKRIMESNGYSTNKTRLLEGIDALVAEVGVLRIESTSAAAAITSVTLTLCVTVTIAFIVTSSFMMLTARQHSKADHIRLLNAMIIELNERKLKERLDA